MAHWSNKVEVEFSTIAERLHILTSTEPRKGGGASHKHAYFLECDTGNLLFHGPGRPGFFKEHREFFDDHGGIALQVMPHGDDASPACLFVEQTWGAPIFVSRWDVAQVQKRTRQPFEGGFENGAKPASEVDSFHLPGHTAGFHCFRWEGNSEKYLCESPHRSNDPAPALEVRAHANLEGGRAPELGEAALARRGFSPSEQVRHVRRLDPVGP